MITTAKPITVSESAETASHTDRLVAIDRLRGLAMILMAIDHAMSLAGAPPIAESYGGLPPELGPLPYVLIGLITNIASSIFFVLAGTGMAFFIASRERRGWTDMRITRFFLTRATILIVLDILIEPTVWHTPITFDVLSAIAFCIVVVAFVRHLRLRILAISAGVLFLVYPLLVNAIPLSETTPDSPIGYVTTILLHYNHRHPPYVEFPALARLSLVLFGYVWGVMLAKNQIKVSSHLLKVGFAGLAITLVLRVLGGYGNFFPYQSDMSPIYFFIFNKQPPSIVFLLFNLSLATFLLAWINQHQAHPVFSRTPLGNVLSLFGQTALFFYVVHLLLFSKVISHIIGLYTLPLAGETGLLEAVIGIVIMIPLCATYRWLRKKYPQSVLQYL